MRRVLPLLLLAPAVAAADEPAPDAAPPVQVAAADPAPAPVPSVPAYTVAGPGATMPSPPGAEAPAEPAAPTGLDLRRRDDAAAGRSFFAETAQTAPRGRVTVEMRAPTLPVIATGVRVGVTDRLEIGGTIITVADEGSLAGISIKGQLWRGTRAAIAAGLNTYSADGETLYDAHLEGTSCLDRDCVAAATLSLNFFGFTDEETVPVLAGAGLSVGRAVQFIGEVHQTRVDDEALTVGYVGLRAAGPRFSIDGGVGFGVDSSACYDCSTDIEALPFLGVAGRL
ncbi:MAG: hypothetical protein JNK64_07555 [Myxococcales bacterium]|nr:hypothetical protein [Myxococcales bacterium]